MGKLYVVRHADAGNRGTSPTPDAERALSERGWRQAEGIAKDLGGKSITRLLASPFVRCVQTLEPLSKVVDLSVEPDARLAEGTGAAGALAVAAELRGERAVLCSHGDVIPDLLDHLLSRGAKLKGELRWQKASTWVLSWDGDQLAKGTYLPPRA